MRMQPLLCLVLETLHGVAHKNCSMAARCWSLAAIHERQDLFA